jgi:hypothetical protein
MSARRERIPLSGRSNKGALTSPIAQPGSARNVQERSARREVDLSSSRKDLPRDSARRSAVRNFGRFLRFSPILIFVEHSLTRFVPYYLLLFLQRGEPQTEYLSRSNKSSARASAQGSDAFGNYVPRSGRSAASDSSELSVNEVLRRLREKSDHTKNMTDMREINALGDYNAFSRPRPSKDLPLRSVLLCDDSVNNFPRSKTRSELLKKIRVTSAPHPSYDLDLDGYVSQEDYKLAKRFDFDGNGVLDPDERAIGKRVLADEFFKEHAKSGDLGCFGKQFVTNSHKKNVDSLANAYSFERAYERLLSVERTLKAGSSAPILDCMKLGDDTLTKHNYFANKFDATAWNDFDAVPRSASIYGLEDHGGSRKRLMFTRKQRVVEDNTERMRIADEKKVMPNTRRMDLITNVAVENS